MGIEQNNQGAYLPDKDTQWPKMTPEERSKVYGSLKETYGGPLKRLDDQTELAKKRLEDEVKKDLGMEIDDFWQNINSLDLSNQFEASDPTLKGMPVSMALLNTFKGREIGQEKYLMYFCLNYLQNAPENKAKNPHGNIDFVPKDGKIIIDQNTDLRFTLKIQDGRNNTLFEGYLFPSS